MWVPDIWIAFARQQGIADPVLAWLLLPEYQRQVARLLELPPSVDSRDDQATAAGSRHLRSAAS